VVRGKSGLRVVGSLEVVTGHLNNQRMGSYACAPSGTWAQSGPTWT
jgi:hypothetical protein